MKRLDPAVKYGNVGDAYVVMEETEDGDLVWWDEAENELDRLRTKVASMQSGWDALFQAAGCGDLKPEAHSDAVLRYIQETLGRANETFRESRALREENTILRAKLAEMERWKDAAEMMTNAVAIHGIDEVFRRLGMKAP